MSILGMITLGAALLPTIVIMAIVLSNARNKREPIKKVASVFGISALSTIPAAVLESVGNFVLALLVVIFSLDISKKGDRTIYELFQFMLIVGPVEEACKYFTFKWIIFHDRDFDNTYDGVIYGAASALGFATLENLLYVFMDNDSQLHTAVMRAILSVPMHAITGIVMGYWFGISKYRRYNNIRPETRPERKAFLFAVVLHGAYDFIVTVPEIYSDSTAASLLFLVLLIAVMGSIYYLTGKTVRRAKAETHNIYNRYYYEQLDGAMQDMMGGKTSEKRRLFGLFGQRQGFDPYNPYAGMDLAQAPAQQNNSYVYGSQQPYNPYYNASQPYPQQYGQNVQQPVYSGVDQPSQPVYGDPAQQPYMNTGGNNGFQAPPSPAPEPPKSYCSNCGAAQKQGVRYCSFCGSRMSGQ